MLSIEKEKRPLFSIQKFRRRIFISILISHEHHGDEARGQPWRSTSSVTEGLTGLKEAKGIFIMPRKMFSKRCRERLDVIPTPKKTSAMARLICLSSLREWGQGSIFQGSAVGFCSGSYGSHLSCSVSKSSALETSSAGRSILVMADYFEQHPETLIHEKRSGEQ